MFDPKDWIFKSQRQRVSPFPNYMSMECVCDGMKNFVGYEIDEILYFITENVHFLFLTNKSYEKVGRGVADNIYKDYNLVKRLTKEQKKYGVIFVNFCKKSWGKDLSKLSNEDLLKIYQEFEVKYKEIYMRYGWVWTAEDFIIKDLFEIIKKRIKDNIKVAEIVNILTQEPTAMVATIERKAFYELGLKILKNDNWVKLIRTSNKEEINKEKKLVKLINKHVENYFWLTRDYEDPIIDFKKVIDRLVEYFSGDTKAQYSELINEINQNKQDKKKYLKELKLDKAEEKYFSSMRETAYLKELRKRYVSEGLYYFDKVLIEIGKRLFLSIKQVRYMCTDDVKKALIDGVDVEEELNKRNKLSLWYSVKGKTEIITGEEAKINFDKFCSVDKNATEFIGMAVSPGIARGPVCLIMNPDECDKVQKGDIILSVQVVPSFSTAIMKAGGLICDGGHGITTHPATLAREAGIPAVIQTRFAREVLKDGDMVEVDGYKGIVKKL